MRKMLLVAGFLSLVSCQNVPGSGPGALPAPSTNATIAKTVVGAEQTLTLLEQAALVYVKLPRCGTAGATQVCSDPALVRRLRQLDVQAYNAVIAARKNEALVDFAWQAVGAFQAVVPQS